MISKVLTSKSSTGLMSYLGKETAHSTRYTDERNLVVSSHNFRNDYSGKFNWAYSAQQMVALRELSNRQDKETQAYHLIISFSDDDFPKATGKTLQEQAKQALKLVDGFLEKRLGDKALFATTIQRDGSGGYLHAHVAISGINVDGTAFDTPKVHMVGKAGLQRALDSYMVEHFPEVTGREFTPVVPNSKPELLPTTYWLEKRKAQYDGVYSWKEDIYNRVEKASYMALSMTDFYKYLDKAGVTATPNTYHGKESLTFEFDDPKDKHHKIRAYRVKRGKMIGLGEEFMIDPLTARIKENARQQAILDREKQGKQVAPTVPAPKIKTTQPQKTEQTVHIFDAVPPQKPVISQPVKTEQKRKKRRKRKTVKSVNKVPKLKNSYAENVSQNEDFSLRDSLSQIPDISDKSKQHENNGPSLP